MKEKQESYFLQGKYSGKEVLKTSGQVSFDWNLLYECNYRCPHCFFEGKWEEYGKRTVYKSVKEWMSIWKRVYDKYGRASIVITGGEPFEYPDFINLVKELSNIHWPLNVSSNSSGNLKEFAEKTDPSRVSVTLSFQPGFNKLEDVIAKVKLLKGKGFASDYINLCMYPKYLKDFEGYIKTAEKAGEVIKVIPFCGVYNGKTYPDGYSREEKKMLGIDGTWEKNVNTKGLLCAAGSKSALIFPDGKVARCGQIGERHVIGNIFEENFSLMENAEQCDAQMCPCLKIIT